MLSCIFTAPFKLSLIFEAYKFVRFCVRLVVDFKLRFPQGTKTKLYKRAKLEKFAPYVMKDGLVCRLSVYDDNQRQSSSRFLILLLLSSLIKLTMVNLI